MWFKGLLVAACLCLSTVPVSAATYVGTLQQGFNLIDLGKAFGRSIRANIMFSAPVDASIERKYYISIDTYDRKTGTFDHRSDYRSDGYSELNTRSLVTSFVGFDRRYYRNFVYTKTLDSSFQLFATAPAAVDYIARISASGVPEPSTWALMILGIGLAGVALRRNRIRLAPSCRV